MEEGNRGRRMPKGLPKARAVRMAVSFPVVTFFLLLVLQKEVSKENIILSTLVSFVSILGYFAVVETSPASLSGVGDSTDDDGSSDPLLRRETKKRLRVYEAESFETILQKLSDGIFMEREMVDIIQFFKEKTSKKDAAVDLCRLGLFPILVSIIKEFVGREEIAMPTVDLLNRLLSISDAKEAIMSTDDRSIKGYLQDLLHVYQLMLNINEIREQPAPTGSDEKEELFFSGDNCSSSSSKETSDSAAKARVTAEEEPLLTAAIRSGSSEKKWGSSLVAKEGYKLYMTMGILSADSIKVQSLIGDRAGVKWIMSTAFCKENIKNHKYVKWGCWSIFNITFQHPPNKGDFYALDGLKVVTNALSLHKTDLDIARQACALILSILSPDAQCKFPMGQARQNAMSGGLVDILTDLQKIFKDDSCVVATSQNILNSFMTDWS